jgi:hypothetical protein
MGIKLSKRTLDILKNFSTINTGLIVNQGSVLNTLSPSKNILAEARVDEVFTKSFAIWDLNKFLGTASLFKDPELTFAGDVVTIKEGKNQIVYKAAEESTLKTPTKAIQFPENDRVEFLSQTQLN